MARKIVPPTEVILADFEQTHARATRCLADINARLAASSRALDESRRVLGEATRKMERLSSMYPGDLAG